ncbi:hypothetical protein Q5752_000023 [Cryptotrichosporon argae]
MTSRTYVPHPLSSTCNDHDAFLALLAPSPAILNPRPSVSAHRSVLYVSGFSSQLRARDLAYEFERYGRLVRCDIPALKSFSASPFAFVEFRDERDAEDAYYDMHGRSIDGRRISVQWAKRPPSAAWRAEDSRRDRRSPPPRRRSPTPPPRRRSPSPRRRSPSPRRDRDDSGRADRERDDPRDARDARDDMHDDRDRDRDLDRNGHGHADAREHDRERERDGDEPALARAARDRADSPREADDDERERRDD